jgi:hypothetical protein
MKKSGPSGSDFESNLVKIPSPTFGLGLRPDPPLAVDQESYIAEYGRIGLPNTQAVDIQPALDDQGLIPE